jgi:hypothetical protein
MKITILFLVALSCSQIIAQNQNLPLKEEYDIYNSHRISIEYNPCLKNIDTDAPDFGDGMAKVLEGYISMFEATGDKAYLNKFVLQSLCIMENRHDFNAPPSHNEPRWVNENHPLTTLNYYHDGIMYHDGYLCAAFARFIHFIKLLNPELYYEPIYPFEELQPQNYSINSCNCNKFNQQFLTYGEYADWLENRVGETLWWYLTNGYWSNDNGFLQKDYEGDFTVAVINKQVGFARALLYIGLTSGEHVFITKAMIMANLFKTIHFSDICDNVYDKPLFILNNNNNSYSWYYNGWNLPIRNCLGTDYELYFNIPSYFAYLDGYIEDVSHGSITTLVPLDFYRHQPNSPFTLNDMIRFRNTFTQSIYVPGGYSNCGVNGTNDQTCLMNAEIQLAQYSAVFSWAHLIDFDEVANNLPNIYDVLMEEYSQKLLGHSPMPLYANMQYSGGTNKGHAELVKAQWERESVNITFFNRIVPYNQNFFSRGTLTIAPMESTFDSYAEPTTSDKIFIIEPNVDVEITAGTAVHIKPGFHAKKGSSVRIYVNPLLCANNKTTAAVSQHDEFSSNDECPKILLNDTEISHNISVYPNPFYDQFVIEITNCKETIIQLYVIDNAMKILVKENIYTDSDDRTLITFEGSHLSQGVYFLSLFIGNENPSIYKIIKL